jgi:hypothetical protein
MDAEKLAEELADFWFSVIAEAGWEHRARILKEIHAQLRADMATRAEYEAVAPRFVAALVDRLGEPPVTNRTQAEIYATSAFELHREAARIWSERAGPDRPSGRAKADGDRRRFSREAVDAISEIWLAGRRSPCQLVDLSLGGARVMLWEPAPVPGTEVRLALPNAGIRDATVVFRNDVGMGIRFADQPAA